MTLLLRKLQVAVQWRAGKPPTYAEMEEWTGTPEGTLKDWFRGRGRPTAEFVVSLLERVEMQSRSGIFEAVCRTDPQFSHPMLQCDKTTISALKSLITRPNGLIFIEGESDEAKTLLFTALGHAFLFLTERPRRVCGIDRHDSDWFVPVPGLFYCRNEHDQKQLREAVNRVWPEMEKGRHRLVMLNGVWEVIPDLHPAILDIAVRNPVVVTLASGTRLRRRKHPNVPVHLITITEDRQRGQGARIGITAI